MKIKFAHSRKSEHIIKKKVENATPRQSSIRATFNFKESWNMRSMTTEVENATVLFLENQNVSTWQAYKDSVQKFLRFVSKQAYRIQNTQGLRLDYKILVCINLKIEKLGIEFLNNQSNSLYLAGQIDEIRGLLFDLFS